MGNFTGPFSAVPTNDIAYFYYLLAEVAVQYINTKVGSLGFKRGQACLPLELLRVKAVELATPTDESDHLVITDSTRGMSKYQL